MYDLEQQTFVVLEFSSVKKLTEKKARKEITFNELPIIEIAAVKIKKGEICDRFTSFYSIEGYDMKNYEIDDDDNWVFGNSHGLTGTHLIGAPLLKDQIGNLNYFIASCLCVGNI